MSDTNNARAYALLVGCVATTGSETIGVWCLNNIRAGANTVRPTAGSTLTDAGDMAIYEVASIGCSADPAGGSSEAVAGPTSSPGTGTIATTHASDFVLAYIADFAAATAPTSYSNNFTYQTHTNWAASSAYLITTTTGNYSTTGSGATDVSNWMATMVGVY